MSDNCNSCGNTTPITYYYNSVPCTTSTSSTGTYDSSIIMYTGSALTAIGVEPNTNIEEVLAAINEAVGTISGIDWSDFDYSCLGPYTTAEGFVEGISDYVCTLNDTVDTFINTTFPAEVTTINDTIDGINEPGLTSCSFVGVVPADNVTAILTKLLTATCSINETINPEDADWNTYFSTSPVPTNVTDGFNVVLAQIGSILTTLEGVQALPTFNNENTCLPTPVTATDTLYNTVVKIRDYVCELPTFNIDDLTWTSCISNPNPGGGADILSALQTILQYLDTTYTKRVVTWDSDYFDVTYDVPDNTCSGMSVTLQSGLGFEDKLVALDASDTDPNYLLNKITAGTNISFDTVSAPGTVIIDCDAVDEKVKANSGDTTSGYLIDKIEGQSDSTSAISLVESYNSTTDKVDITPAINYGNLAEQILTIIAGNGTLYSQMQTLICSMQPCPEGEDRTIYGTIVVADGSDPVEFNASFSQETPTLAMYNSGNISATAGTVINTGGYAVTSATASVTGIVTVENLDGGAALPYNIYVTDLDDNPITGSSSQAGSISPSSTLTIDPFVYGTATNMKVHIELGTGTTTTTSTTTTTTTTLP